MPSAAQGYDMYNARFDDSGKDHDTYFRRDEKSGEYLLKDGYEERFLGSGDYVQDGNALTTFSNDYDDLWDSYEPDRDKKVYGIFKKPSAPSARSIPSVDPTPSEPEPEAKATEPMTYSYSPEIKEAKSRVQKYKEDALSGATTNSIYKNFDSNQGAQSFLDNKKYQFMGV